jgi:hypothetical protein
MQQQNRSPSCARRRLVAAAARAGVDVPMRDQLVGAVLDELATRMTLAQWRELCGWLPWEARVLAGARPAARGGPRDDLVAGVVTSTGLPRPVAVVAVRSVLAEIVRIVPPRAIPPRLMGGVPGV